MCVSHGVEDTSHVGHEAKDKHVVMVVHMVMFVQMPMMLMMCVGAVFSGMMLMFVHMYMKLLYLWNVPLYSEKLSLFTH